MKDSEFIELLNLYLDHEISAVDAARLEAEVAAKPARRRIYEDYCRMQKACKALAADFATAGVGEAETAAPAARRNIVAFESARPQRRAGFYGAGALVAAAACVAVIFFTRKQDAAQPAGAAEQGQNTFAAATSAASTSASATAMVVEPMVPVTLPAPAVDDAMRVAGTGAGQFVAAKAPAAAQPKARTGLTLASSPVATSEALLLVAEQNGSQFDWIQDVKFDPVPRVQIDQFRFDASAPRTVEGRQDTLRSTPQGAIFESAAFKITK